MEYPHELAAHILRHDKPSDNVKELITETQKIYKELIRTQEKLFNAERDLKISENTVYQLQSVDIHSE